MVTRRFTGIRTPKKEKIWAQDEDGIVGQILTANQMQAPRDILLAWKAAVGVNFMRAATAMRIVGTLVGGNGVTDDAVRNHMLVWGFAWLENNIANEAAGSANIPDPNNDGTREANWLQTGTLSFRSVATTLSWATDQLLGSIRLDIKQMRKQPTVSHELCLVIRTLSDGGGVSAPTIRVNLKTMLALP